MLEIRYFVHGSTPENEAGVRAGWADPSLSDKGLAQAQRLADRVASIDVEAVFSSDLVRARQTASIAFAKYPRFEDSRLREMNYGNLNGCPGEMFVRDEARSIDVPFEQGECCLDVEARVRAFLLEMTSRYERIAIVSHRFPQLALEVVCKGLSWEAALAGDWRSTGQWQPGWDYHCTDDAL